MTMPARADELQVHEAFSAARKGDFAALKRALYLSPSSFLESRDPNGGGASLLHVSVSRADEGMTSLLLSYGFSCGRIDDVGRTPLHMATSPVIVSLLLQHPKSGAQAAMTEQDFEGNLPLHSIAKARALPALGRLLAFTPALSSALRTKDRQGGSLLHAIAEHAPRILPRLLTSDLDLHQFASNGVPLSAVCSNPSIRRLIAAHELIAQRAHEEKRDRLVGTIESRGAAHRAREFLNRKILSSPVSKHPH